MAKQTINIGTSANKGDGDPLRTAFNKINENFTELYSDVSYVPDDPTQWTDPAPTTLAEAIDRLAAAVYVLNGGTAI